jgi:cytochrome P450/ferredoxin-NADP reductase
VASHHPPVTDRLADDDPTLFYDPLSYAAYDDPYELYRELRDRAPVYYNARRDLWVVSRYEDVSACLRNHDQLVNIMGDDVDETHETYGPGQLIALDPPHHTRVRNVLEPLFAPDKIRAMQQQIRRTSRELLAQMREKVEADFATDFALPLVFDVSLRLLGAPASESVYWRDHLVRSMARTIGQLGVPGDAAASNREVEERLGEILSRRRDEIKRGANTDTSDVISLLVSAGDKGVIDEAEQAGLAHLVLSASTDVSAALLTNCMAVLDRFPGLQAYLHRNPSTASAFVEETLRYESPAQNLSRQTATEISVRGVTIPENARVVLLIASANRDERVYPNPDRFDISRTFTTHNKILAFGDGIHSCIGASLARLTAKGAVEELVVRLDGDEMRVTGMPRRWAKQMVRGFAKLPVEFVSSKPVAPIRKKHISSLHIETVKHRTTTVTLTTREFEADVRVEGKKVVAEGVATLILREVNDFPLPRWDPGSHVDLILGEAPTRQYSLCGDVNDRYAWRYLFIAGGIGITPILPMIAAAERAGAEWQLVYGGRQRASMAFLDELDRYGEKVAVRPQDETGLLDLDTLLGRPLADTKVYCCGPEPLLSAVEQRCASWPSKSLHVERFVAKPLTEPLLSEAFEVYPEQSELTLDVPPERSILDVVEEAGDGVPDHRDSVLDEEERQANDCMMICISRSRTPRLVLDL